MPGLQVSPADYRALAEFRFQIRAFLSFSEKAARAVGLEPQQHQLLLACKGLPESLRPTIGTFARRLCVEHHTVVALVDKLEGNSLVRRYRGDRDRREVLLEITASGEALLAELSSLHREQIAKVGPAMLHALSAVLVQHSAAGVEDESVHEDEDMPPPAAPREKPSGTSRHRSSAPRSARSVPRKPH
jgi:DNA-binding MarR family transcriptional regulator